MGSRDGFLFLAAGCWLLAVHLRETTNLNLDLNLDLDLNLNLDLDLNLNLDLDLALDPIHLPTPYSRPQNNV